MCVSIILHTAAQPVKTEKILDILGTDNVIITDLKPETTLKEVDDLSYLGVAPEAKRTVRIQLSAVSLECLPCKHNICSTCMEEYKILPIPVCPAEDCSGKASEVDESNLCDGICKKYVEEGKYITTSCCQAKICSACFETISGRKYSTGVEERCPSTECLRHADIARCQAEVKCKNLPISGFPSKDECEHAMCIQCLEKMIDNCESAGSLPRCPNESCNALYNVESVIAMRAMLPGKSAFFNKLSLDNNYYYLIKDEIVTPIKFSANFKSVQRYCEIDVKLSDGTESRKLPFDRIGTIADLIREIRRELNIAPEEKVYGYYLTRPLNVEGKSDDDGYWDKPAEKLDINAESINETVEKLNLSTAITIVADIAGIVQVKNDTALNDTGI
ncbi:hypothetical protein QQG55_4060 [Brugia pahangi]